MVLWPSFELVKHKFLNQIMLHIYLYIQLYDIKYSYWMQIICTQFYGVKYTYLIQIIYTQLYGFEELIIIILSKQL